MAGSKADENSSDKTFAPVRLHLVPADEGAPLDPAWSGDAERCHPMAPGDAIGSKVNIAGPDRARPAWGTGEQVSRPPW